MLPIAVARSEATSIYYLLEPTTRSEATSDFSFLFSLASLVRSSLAHSLTFSVPLVEARTEPSLLQSILLNRH